MNAPALQSVEPQNDALTCGLDGSFVAIVGSAGTGKTTALGRRLERALSLLVPGERVIVSAAGAFGVPALRARLGDLTEQAGVTCARLGDVAFTVLEGHRFEIGMCPDLALIDDARAEELFAESAASLYALEWEEFLSAEWDPEIPGLRAPDRFAATAYRLIRKLRMAGLSPEAFARAALRGATEFYGRMPNFAKPDLIEATPAKYRDSLRASPQELARQHAREVDLSKILCRVYEAYLTRMRERGCVTRIDALVEAAELLERRPDVRAGAASRFRLAFVDDAQDLAQSDVRFLRALFGEGLAGVTLAGDLDQRTLAFAGPRAEGILEAAPHRFVLERPHRGHSAVLAAARAVLPDAKSAAGGSAARANVHVARFLTMGAEAAYVADAVTRTIGAGTAPNDIAVILRSLRCVDPYARALLERDVPIDISGEGSLFEFSDVEDALAALWTVADPLRNDWLLRNLEAPWLALSDASIAALCEEAPDAQTPLFELQQAQDDARGRRWDRQRDFRLARNALRGDRDGDLTPSALERLSAFRAARKHWLAEERRLGVASLARRILEDTSLATAPADNRGRLRRSLVERLLADVARFAAERPRTTLRDYLLHAQHVAASGCDLLSIAPLDREAVALLTVEAAKGRDFAVVFVVDVRAGAFPRYYVPDAFQFSPRAGMIPKENVGDDATATRTAKFTYFQYHFRVPKRYYAEERRALYCAVSRARKYVSITASGRATRGVGAPELLEELSSAIDDAARSSDAPRP